MTATLTLHHRRHFYEPQLPHIVFIDGLYAGTMQGDKMQRAIPQGNYALRIQCGGRFPLGKNGKSIDLSVSATAAINISGNKDTNICFHDRERLWNILFDIDLIAWIISIFVAFPPVYKIISDTFFAIWLIRLVIIRKRYYKIIQQSD